MKPMLKPPGTERLKLDFDELLSSFAFQFNLRRYNLGWHEPQDKALIFTGRSENDFRSGQADITLLPTTSSNAC
jgi:hypothetical protein